MQFEAGNSRSAGSADVLVRTEREARMHSSADGNDRASVGALRTGTSTLPAPRARDSKCTTTSRRDSLPSELETDPGAHHRMPGIVNVRVKVSLPKPFGPIVVNADTGRMNVLARVYMAGLENPVEGDAVVPVYLVAIGDVSVLLPSVQAHVKNCEGLNAIIITQPVTDS